MIPKTKRTMRDSDRDAARYRQVLLALQRATGEINAAEEAFLNLEELLIRLLPDIAQALNAEQSFIALAPENANLNSSLDIVASYPKQNKHKRCRQLTWSGTLTQLTSENNSVVIDPLDEDSVQIIAGLECFKATATILVRVQTKEQVYVIGACNKTDPALGPFLATDGLVLSNILELLAIGTRVGEQRRQELESIQETSAAINAELDLQELLPLIVERAAKVFDAPATSIMLWDEKEENLVVFAQCGLSKLYTKFQKIPAAKAIQTSRTEEGFRSTVTLNLRKEAMGNTKWVKKEKLDTALVAFLVVDNCLTGLLNIYSSIDKPRKFRLSEQKLAQVFANHVAIAIQNAELYERTQTLLAAGQNITALRPIRDVLQAITDSLWASFGYDVVTLYPYQAQDKQFDRPVVSGELSAPDRISDEIDNQHLEQTVLPAQDMLFRSDTSEDPVLANDFTKREKVQSSGYVRLVIGGEPVGILFVNYRKPHIFSKNETRAVQLFAQQAVMAIHNTRQFAALQNQLDQKEMILASSQGIVARQSPRKTLQHILETLVQVEGYDIVTLFPYHSNKKTVEQPLTAGQAKTYSQIIGHYHEGSVAEKRLTQGPDAHYSSDPVNDPLLKGRFVDHEEIKAAGSLRIKNGEDTVGLLFVNKREPYSFTPQDHQTLQVYAHQIALAFFDARLIDRGQERIGMLARIGEKVGQTLHLETLLEVLYGELQNIFPNTVPKVLLYDEVLQVLHLPYPDSRSDLNKEHQYESLKLGQGICGWVAKYRQTLNVSNVHCDSRYLKLLSTTNSELAVPILLGERLVGVLNIESSIVANFDDEDLGLVEAVANQVAAGIHNAEQYERSEEWQRRLLALHESAKAVTASLERKHSLQAILAEALRLTNALIATIQIRRGDKLYFEEVYPAYRREQIIRNLGPAMSLPLNGLGLTVKVANTGQPILDNNVQQNETYVDITDGAVNSELIVPLVEDGEIIGVLNVEHQERDTFNDEDQKVLAFLASLAVLVLQNVDKYERLERKRQQMEALYEASRAITQAGLERDSIMQTILDQAVSVTGAFYGTLHIVEENDVKLVASWPAERLDEFKEKLGYMPLDGMGVATRAIREDDAQLVFDVTKDEDYVDLTGETRSELAVVLRSSDSDEGQPIGVLNVEHKEVGGLDEEDRDLLITLANLAVVAFNNAAQFQELKETKDELLAAGAIAWMGLFGSEWSHTVAQKTYSIRSYVEILADSIAQQEAYVEHSLNKIDLIAQEIQAVPLVLPSHIEVDRGQTILIDGFVDKLIKRWCSPHKELTCHLELRCPDIQVKVDENLLKMALQKLVENAMRHMILRGGGSLTVDSCLKDNNVVIGLEDVGGGIREEYEELYGRERIPKSNGDSGSGMGALIANFILKKYGGGLDLIWNKKGIGIRIEIAIPIYNPHPAYNR